MATSVETGEYLSHPMIGLIVQKLPGADNDKQVDKFYREIVESEYWNSLINNEINLDGNKFVEFINQKYDCNLKRYPLDYYCRCEKEKFQQLLVSMKYSAQSGGEKELQNESGVTQKPQDSESTRVRCHYCNKLYVFDNSDLQSQEAEA